MKIMNIQKLLIDNLQKHKNLNKIKWTTKKRKVLKMKNHMCLI